MKKLLVFFIVVLLSLTMLFGAPSLDVRESPVTDTYDWTGPQVDPDAYQGQWIFCNESGVDYPRSHEFYDNHDEERGNYLAIEGVVTNIVYDSGSGTNIMAFDIRATITNDTPAEEWGNGSNSHQEALSTLDQYEGPLYCTVLTADFAITELGHIPSSWTSPYYDNQPYIIADNEDGIAWYCWTPENPSSTPWGDYFVPTWKFGNAAQGGCNVDPIMQGGSATRTLMFSVDGTGIPPGDSRYNPIVQSLNNGDDIFLNRTNSLKISEWIETVAIDNGSYEPIPPDRSSDVSVFHNINPEDPPCPVELSTFYGMYIENPTLYWTTETETDNSHWNIYRAVVDDFANSQAIHELAGQGTVTHPTDYTFIDTNPILSGETYWYWIESVSSSGESEIFDPIYLTIPSGDAPLTPESYGVAQNYPNPFNPSTSIDFTLSEEGIAKLAIYDLKGELITVLFDGFVEANTVNSEVWNGEDKDGKKVASGVYFYKLITSEKTYTKKMLLIK